MMTRSSFTSDADGTEIATYRWHGTGGAPRGVVQIAHGLAEHGARYDRLARALSGAGFIVGGCDHRGQGQTSKDALGHFGAVGFGGLIADIAQYGRLLAAEHPRLPIFLFAHSMGSFAAQSLIVDDVSAYAGVILSGSTALDVVAAGMKAVEGPVGLQNFNLGFKHRTGYEWLSRDESEVDAYVADPRCGFEVPQETTIQLFFQAERLADPGVLATISTDVSLLIASGTDDPLAGGGHFVELLAERYQKAGLTDVTLKLYPGARHEIVNETNRDEVTADLIAWLNDHTTPTTS